MASLAIKEQHKKIFIILLIFSFLDLAETFPEDQAEKLATAIGVIYVGMPKEALYQVYTPYLQKGYRKIGNEEWITFSDWTTEEPGDRITFYLKDNNVKGWKKDEPSQPECAHERISI